MRHEKRGQRLEYWVRQKLRDRDCVIIVDRDRDIRDKVDYLVVSVGPHRFDHPVEVQLTLLRDDLLKLRWYRESRGYRLATSLYVEASRSGDATAKAIRGALEDVAWLGPSARGMVYGIRVGDDGVWKLFDLGEKIAKLESRTSLEKTGHLRRRGVIAGFHRGCFIIASDNEVFRAMKSEVADLGLLHLKDSDAFDRSAICGTEVSFIPKKGDRAVSLIGVTKDGDRRS